MAKENIARNVSKAVNVPVTAGKSYKTAAALESLKSNFAAAGFREKNVLILGAKEEGGAASAWYLADELKHLTLADHDERQARNLAKKIYDETGMAALAAADIKAAVKNADIIIAAEKIGEGFELKKGAVICDLAQSHSLAHLKKERDIFLSGGGLVKLPHCTALGFDFGFPKGCVSPKLAETIVLSLEKKSAPFAVGEKLTAAKLREIKSIAEKHGFSLYPSPLKKMADESKRDFRVTLEKSHEIN
jgi:predicted amino acid dehydrogenase